MTKMKMAKNVKFAKHAFSGLEAYKNDEDVKQECLSHVDRLENENMRIVGGITSFSMLKMEKTLGLPEWVIRVADRIYPELAKTKGAEFAEEFLEAIQIGVNLDEAHFEFCGEMLSMSKSAHTSYANNIEVVSALDSAILLFRRMENAGNRVLISEWDAANAKAEAAAKNTEALYNTIEIDHRISAEAANIAAYATAFWNRIWAEESHYGKEPNRNDGIRAGMRTAESITEKTANMIDAVHREEDRRITLEDVYATIAKKFIGILESAN